MRIAIDAMGGDNAPAAVVEGAVLAAREPGVNIILVGQSILVEEELQKFAPYPDNISIHHASEVVEMDDSPAVTIRKKKESSINIAVKLVAEGKADAIISAGNTGAVVCAVTLGLRLLEGVERPGIAIVYPTLTGNTLVIDAGANIEPKPYHLLQYAIMGEMYARYILHKKNPDVGLLNIGQEESKGTDFIKECHKLLTKSNINFIGNVEGRDIFKGKSDVMVCDGFIGNIVLKVTEGVAEAIGQFLKHELTKTAITKLAAFMGKDAFIALKKRLDYSEYGGAPLLGVNGNCIICHGSSGAEAIKNAIRVAGEFSKHNVNKHIVEAIKNL